KSKLKLPVYDFEMYLLPMANPPAKLPNWKAQSIVDTILEDTSGERATVLVIPYLPDFSVNTFKYLAKLNKLPLTVVTVGTRNLYHYNFKTLLESNYIIAKTGKSVPFSHIRFEYAEKSNELINDHGPVFGGKLQLIAEYDLPDQTRARLYKKVAPYSNREKIPILRAALKIDPEHPWARLALGEAYLEEEEFQPALAEFEKVVELLPDWPGGYLNIGRVCLAEKKTEEAFRQIRLSLKIAPDWAFARYVLGEAYEQAGELPEAIVQYEFARQSGKYDLPEKAEAKLKALGCNSSGEEEIGTDQIQPGK
ncbi:MAG: tetratricopeptide repeat protein, partial [Candidatus Auribacterota bacterium]|nr:tetratricopeptide repeat protein [Candidatus Auribacterota bacterium]